MVPFPILALQAQILLLGDRIFVLCHGHKNCSTDFIALLHGSDNIHYCFSNTVRLQSVFLEKHN